MTLTGCPRCDWHGPEVPGQQMITAVREVHRGMHEIGRALAGTLLALTRNQRESRRT